MTVGIGAWRKPTSAGRSGCPDRDSPGPDGRPPGRVIGGCCWVVGRGLVRPLYPAPGPCRAGCRSVRRYNSHCFLRRRRALHTPSLRVLVGLAVLGRAVWHLGFGARFGSAGVFKGQGAADPGCLPYGTQLRVLVHLIACLSQCGRSLRADWVKAKASVLDCQTLEAKQV
jgi:hypothetical protein